MDILEITGHLIWFLADTDNPTNNS